MALVQYDGEKFESGYAVDSESCFGQSEKVELWSPLGEIVFCVLSERFTFKSLSAARESSFHGWVNSCFPPGAEIATSYDGWLLNISASKRSPNYGECLKATNKIFPKLGHFTFPGSVETVYYVNHPDGFGLFTALSNFENGLNSSHYMNILEDGDFPLSWQRGHVQFILSGSQL